MDSRSAWVALGNWLVGLLRLPQELGPPLGAGIGAVVILLVLMGVVTYMIWWLRKLLGWMQSRMGPKHVGWNGLLQTPADALKLLSKEGIIPTMADRPIFIVAPAIVFIAAYVLYVTVPFSPTLWVADLNVGVVYVTAVTSMTVIGIVLGAWASNNKYALLSAFRSAAQMVSYEVPFAFALLGPVSLAGSFSFLEIVQGPHGQIGGITLREMGLGTGLGLTFLDWFVITQPVGLLCFFIAGLAENNVTPFDIVEAESEIVAGFHVEYSGMKFALFFLAEFANTMTLAVLTALLFFGGWTFPLADGKIVELLGGSGSPLATLWHFGWMTFKVTVLISVVFWLRGTLPRVRVDQLMDLGWKWLIPITIANLMITGGSVLFGAPRWALAVVNWAILVGVVFYGARKPLPEGTDTRRPAVSAAPVREGSA